MKNGVKILLLTISLIFQSVNFIYPQTEQYKFRHLTTEDGLPTNVANRIIKDAHGMIWITTNAGLCRYDGYDFKTYQYNPDDSNSLSHNNLSGPIIEDSDGNIWIGTLFGLNKFDPFTETFIRYTPDPDDPGSISSGYIKSLCEDRNGFIWVGTGLNGELNRFDPLTNSFSSYSIVKKDTSDFCLVFSVYEDSDGILWVGTSHGLFQFNRRNESAIEIKPIPPLPENYVPSYRKILEDQNGDLWFLTDWAIMTYEKHGGDLALLQPMWGGEIQTTTCPIRDMLIEPFGKDQILWIAACGLVQLNPLTHEYALYRYDRDDPEGLCGNEIRGLFKDNSGILWVASSQCLNVLDKQQSRIKRNKVFYKDYLSDATVLFEDNENNYWIGTNGKGVLYFDQKMNFIHQYNVSENSKKANNPEGSISAIFQDNESNIWVGTPNGMYLLDKKTNKFKKCLLTGAKTGSKTAPFIVHVIFEDAYGIIWIGTQSGVYQHKKDGQVLTIFTHLSVNESPLTRPVKSIMEDSFGYLWIGVDATGLYCQTPELRGTDSFIHYMHEPGNRNSLSNSNVMSIYEDLHGSLWIGTRHGLNRFNRENNSFERMEFEINSAANFIYDINGDNSQNLWLTTQNGLLRLKMGHANKQYDKPFNFKKFLPFKDIRLREISKFKNGAFFLGGKSGSKNGYFSFHPDSIIDDHLIPPIVITEFQVKNEPFKLDSNILFKKQITLSHYENFFSFKFAALDYTAPKQNQYAYYLEGLEDDWIYLGNRHLVNYTAVPPGKYTFRAKGSNNDGYWNEAGASIQITILPPLWKTWWAYVFYMLAIVSIIYSIIHFYLQRQRLIHTLALEQVEAEKLKELDTMKSRFFANISHEFRTPLTLILGPLQHLLSRQTDENSVHDLNMMQRNALRLQNLINQLLNLSKLESGKMKLQARKENIVALVKGYVQLFESLANQKKIDLVFRSEEENIPLFADRDKVEKILYNLLSNAFKFTDEGGRIEVAVHGQQPAVGSSQSTAPIEDWRLKTGDLQRIQIKISDTGRGIPPEKLEHIFNRFYQADDSASRLQEGTGIGLALVKELVELHHGTISVESVEGKGTAFTVILPVGKEYLKEDDFSGGDRSAEDAGKFDLEMTVDKAIGGGPKKKQTSIRYEDSKPLILIVEDNADLRDYIRSFLEDSFQVIEASNGEAGLKQAIETVPDLIVSDVMMPRMDGYELCKKLKTDERTSHIPFILLTARASMESKIEGLETGADDFITKPFDQLELQIRINNLIRQRRKLQLWILNEFKKSSIDHILNIDPPDLTSMDQQFYKRLTKAVLDNISNPDFKVKNLVSLMNMSHSQLHRKMVAITGHTANQFIRSLRLTKASELLANKTATVTEIAFETGFNNLSYFTKCFRHQFGVLPSEYAR